MIDTVAQTPRLHTPEQTLQNVEPWLEQAGVTRLADITGMDSIGIPVVASVRPDSYSLAVDCGKGITKSHAKTSAAMEALERWACDELDVKRFRHAVTDAFETRFPRVLCSAAPDRIDWTTVKVYGGGETIVPYYTVKLYERDIPLSEKCFAVSTNGLASGNTRDEAIASGLFEVIERDALHVSSRKLDGTGKQLPRYDVDSVSDGFTVESIDKIRSAGCELFAYSCDGGLGIPTFLAIIVDRERGNGLYKGYGCHLAPCIALNRAICEAAQARCVIMAGARDDITWIHHRQLIARSQERDWYSDLSSYPIDCSAGDFYDHSTGTAGGDIAEAVSTLQRHNIPMPLIADFPVPEHAPFRVVRVLIPTLEGYFSLHGIESGDRCRG